MVRFMTPPPSCAGVVPGPGATETAAGTTGCLRTHRREEDDLADRGAIGEEHGEPVDAQAEAAGGRHAVLQRREELLVGGSGFVVAGLAVGRRHREAPALVVGVVE